MLQNGRAQKLRAGLLCVAFLLGGRSELFAAQQSSQETMQSGVRATHSWCPRNV